MFTPKKGKWCGREDSNFHALRHSDLNAARLPIPPRPHIMGKPGGPGASHLAVSHHGLKSFGYGALAGALKEIRAPVFARSPWATSFQNTSVAFLKSTFQS